MNNVQVDKICEKCKRNLPIFNFPDKGKWNICRKCNRERSLKYYYENKDRLNAPKKCDICDIVCKYRTAYYNHIKTTGHIENARLPVYHDESKIQNCKKS